MGQTIDYYRRSAEAFFARTVGVDMAAIHQRFLTHVPAGGRILDAGCGSGRDAKAFHASPELAALAAAHLGHFKSADTAVAEYRIVPEGYGRLQPERHFVARVSGNSMDGGKDPIRDGDYLLLELITPVSAGSLAGSVVAIERAGGGPPATSNTCSARW